MALKISMVVTCDQCGAEIHRSDDVKITRVPMLWAEWRRGGWGRNAKPEFMTQERYMKTPLVYCLACADGVAAPAIIFEEPGEWPVE